MEKRLSRKNAKMKKEEMANAFNLIMCHDFTLAKKYINESHLTAEYRRELIYLIEITESHLQPTIKDYFDCEELISYVLNTKENKFLIDGEEFYKKTLAQELIKKHLEETMGGSSLDVVFKKIEKNQFSTFMFRRNWDDELEFKSLSSSQPHMWFGTNCKSIEDFCKKQAKYW